MIDLHIHSHYSKHAEGSLTDIVCSAIEYSAKVIAVTDHAPFTRDTENRLRVDELKEYLDEMDNILKRFSGQLTILKGLEVDYLPSEHNYIENMLSGLKVDYVLGSIHAIPVKGGNINIWDIDRLHSDYVIKSYFDLLEKLISSELFDAVGHPDCILRGGIGEGVFLERFLDLQVLMIQYDISYELNTSGLRKSTYDLKEGKETNDAWNFPSRELIPILNEAGVSFTVGSDAHSPIHVCAGVEAILQLAKNSGVGEVCYYENRKRTRINIDQFMEGSL